MPIIVYGEFANEFIRLSILMASISFTYWADLHWLIRVAGVASHIFVIQFLEAYYLRELLMQLACF